MIDTDSLYQKFENLCFEGFAKTVSVILSAYDISKVTINKIVDKINNGEDGPFYIYRRAIIICDVENKCETTKYAFCSVPLIIILKPTQVIIDNNQLGNINCGYNEICNHLDYLKPLYSWDVNKRDPYHTLELDTLVESLYRSLKLDDNNEDDIRDFIFTLLYIAHFRCLLEIDTIVESLSDFSKNDHEKLLDIINYFLNKRCRFINIPNSNINISKESYKYIFNIIKFDTNIIDSEILASLIYKMVNHEDIGLYGHQTSFTNVEKVLQPLFLDEMQKKANTSTNENVFQIVNEIYETTVFDPTNSPGCYLVASYNGLVQQLRDIESKFNIKCNDPLNISKFIGLCGNTFTANITKLALTFTHAKELKRLGIISFDNINKIYGELRVYTGNELIEDWSKYITPNVFTYIVGSPKFKGYNKLSAFQKEEMHIVFGKQALNNADYCSAWLVKAAKLITGNGAKAAFALTNSVSQGSQATNILNKINKLGCEYIFSYRSFKWQTSSSDNVGVSVVIIGIAQIDLCRKKYIFDDSKKIECKEIGASLLPDIDIRIIKRTNAQGPISSILPPMRKGNMPDGAANILTFTSDSLDEFLVQYPNAEPFIKPLYGGDEFVTGKPSWCLWITDNNLEEALKVEGIRNRIERVRKIRANSTSGKKSKEHPYAFREQNVTSKGQISIIVPCVTSEKRKYFQIGILDSNAIVNNNVNVIFNCDIWILALLESKMHWVWAINAAGGHETRPRYSSELCYNTFPAPQINKQQMMTLVVLSKTLLEVREKYCDKSLGELYNKMPPELVRVHHWIDETVDSLYRKQPFETDGERLMWLKNIYNTLIENE